VRGGHPDVRVWCVLDARAHGDALQLERDGELVARAVIVLAHLLRALQAREAVEWPAWRACGRRFKGREANKIANTDGRVLTLARAQQSAVPREYAVPLLIDAVEMFELCEVSYFADYRR
jgi:hypothetical protein